MTVHILKLCVGIDSFEHLVEVRKGRRHLLPDGTPYNYHITRYRPKRADEILAEGSLYWVIKGFVLVRQRIIGLEPIETDTGVKCKIIMDTKLIRTESQPRRPHQGWRYLEAKDVPKDLRPKDLREGTKIDNLSPEMSKDLSKLGLI